MRKNRNWKLVKGSWISPEPVLPGVWQRKEGGHVVRARAKEGTTGRLKEIWKVLPEVDAATALKWLSGEQARIRAGVVSAEKPKMRFSEYAAQLFEHKVKVKDIRSAKGRETWRNTLEHLVAPTEGKNAARTVDAFGEFFIDKIHVSHVESWKASMAGLIGAGDYSPSTVDRWLSVLRVIMKAAKRELGLGHLATEGIDNFDLSEHETYTEEEPNALHPEEVPAFLRGMRDLHPQHYAMTYLGLATGLRPSSLRPLRRTGPDADVLWDKSRLLVRRSHTVGDEVMNTTKQRVRYAIDLPTEVVDVLRWHVETQLKTAEQQDSVLLFPATNGTFRTPCVLNKPFADVAGAIGLGKTFTQRGLRRTFNDLARTARVEAFVTRSISGHLTEQMQHHYSTVNAAEQRDGIARVVHLFQPGAPGGEGTGEGTPAGGEETKKAAS